MVSHGFGDHPSSRTPLWDLFDWELGTKKTWWGFLIEISDQEHQGLSEREQTIQYHDRWRTSETACLGFLLDHSLISNINCASRTERTPQSVESHIMNVWHFVGGERTQICAFPRLPRVKPLSVNLLGIELLGMAHLVEWLNFEMVIP